MLFIFALWSIMGLDTYCCLIFYGLTLIHLTGPLSQVVVQIMCDIYIWIYIFIYIYIYIYIYIKEKEGLTCWSAPCSFLIWLKKSAHSRFGLNLGVEGKNSLTRNSRTIKHWRSFLNTRKKQEMAFHGINQGERFRFLPFNACLNVNMWSYIV